MIDYLLDNNCDLQIVDGNFVRGESTQQNQKLLLITEPGAWKQYPTVGVGLMSFLKDDRQVDMMRAIRLQFAQDGMTIASLAFEDNKVKVNASYGS